MQEQEIRKLARSRVPEVFIAIILVCVAVPLAFLSWLPLVWAVAIMLVALILTIRFAYDQNLVHRVRHGRYFINPRYLLALFTAAMGFEVMLLVVVIIR